MCICTRAASDSIFWYPDIQFNERTSGYSVAFREMFS